MTQVDNPFSLKLFLVKSTLSQREVKLRKRVTELAQKPDDPSLISGTHNGRRQPTPESCHPKYHGMNLPVCMHMCPHTQPMHIRILTVNSIR